MKRKSINNSDIKKFYKSYRKFYNDCNKLFNYPNYHRYSVNKGNLDIELKKITENTEFETKWIDIIESYLPSIDKITDDPRRDLALQEVIVPVEKASKTNYKSVQFLSQNTRYIKEYNRKKNDLKIDKVLSYVPDDKIDIYENRFIMTLIERLNFIILNAYEVVKKHYNDYLYYKYKINTSYPLYEEYDIDLKIDVNLKKRLNLKIQKANELLLNRIDNMRALISKFLYSQFAKEMQGYKKVSSPISKTNIIKNNPYFQDSYKLWTYLDSITEFKYDKQIKESNIKQTKEFEKDTYDIINHVTTSLINNYINKQFKEKEYTIEKKDIKQYLYYKVNPNFETYNTNDNKENKVINQFYLEQLKNILNNKIPKIDSLENENGKELFELFLEILTITNMSINSLFEINNELGYYEKYLKKDNYEKEINKLLKQYNVIDILRKAKEKDLKDTINLEKDILKKLIEKKSDYVLYKTREKNRERNEQIKKEKNNEIKILKKENTNLRKTLKKQLKYNSYNKKIEEYEIKIKKLMKEKELIKKNKNIKENKNLMNTYLMEINKELKELKTEHNNLIKASKIIKG